RNVRSAAEQVLPLPRTASGRRLPPINELLVRPGQSDHARALFFPPGTNSGGGCHRVQGQGRWIGPDLSTIGTKYGKDELLRSILNPGEAVGFSFRAQIVSPNDGRVLTGLPVEDSADRLVLKTADGERTVIRPGEIED